MINYLATDGLNVLIKCDNFRKFYLIINPVLKMSTGSIMGNVIELYDKHNLNHLIQIDNIMRNLDTFPVEYYTGGIK